MDDFNENQEIASNYDDGHDSDIESRLYAEIHYTNTIIGDDSSLTNAAVNEKSLSNRLESLDGSNNFSTNDKLVSSSDISKESTINIASNNCIQTGVNYIQTVGTSKSNKRLFRNDKDKNESDKFSKQRKKELNENSSNFQGNKKSTDSLLSSNCSSINHQTKNIIDFQDNSGNKIINPFNKQVINKSQEGIQLLSPQFFNIFFGKKSKPKVPKVKKKLSKLEKKQNIKLSALNHTNIKNNISGSEIERNLQHKEIEDEIISSEAIQNEFVQNVQAEKEDNHNIPLVSEIIDLNSESSEDSFNANSKYSMTVPTEKKLKIKETSFKDIESDDSASTSEESIFEVPVPPKPAPPLIELPDSDNNNESDNESDNDSSSSESNVKNIHKNSMNTGINSRLEDVFDIDSDSNETDNLILNCTEIQKGVSNINEIKRMSNRSLSIKESAKREIINERKKIQTVINNFPATENQMSTKDTHKNRKNIPLKEYFFQPMNKNMKSFYNESWGGENFDMNTLKEKMPTDPTQWAILDDDLTISVSKRKRYFGIFCSRCQREGHKYNQCPEPYKPLVCHMCGHQGHVETTCPNKMCLSCGRKQYMYSKTCLRCEKMFCSRCNSRGHISNSCPDLWRRYHQTINKCHAEVPKNVKKIMKPQYELYCCNCARKGHDSVTCKKLRWSLHFPNPPNVTDYNGPEYSEEYTNSEQNANINIDTTCNVSSNFDELNDSTIDLNIQSPLLTSIQGRSSFTKYNTPKRKIIFNIRSTVSDNNHVLKNYLLNLRVPDKDGSSNYNSWKELSSFLKNLVSNMPANFLLEQQENKSLRMKITFPHKHYDSFSKLVQQYASRTTVERGYMFLCWERNLKKVLNLLDNKFSYMKRLQDNALELYEQIKTLTAVAVKTGKNLQEQNKLTLYQQKLMMILSREGFADDSLKKLKQIYKKISRKNGVTQNLKSSKKKKAAKNPDLVAAKEISLKEFFNFIYYYNNVFVPYEPKNLIIYVQKYKEHLETRDRLKNSPFLFPCDIQAANNESNRIEHQSNVINAETSTSSLHQPSSLLSVNTQITSQTSTILSINTSISSNSNFSQDTSSNANILSQNSFTNLQLSKNKQSNNVKSNTTGTLTQHKKYKKLLDSTKQLLINASKLNAPHLQIHIDKLKSKIGNESQLFNKEVRLLQRLVRLERKRKKEER